MEEYKCKGGYVYMLRFRKKDSKELIMHFTGLSGRHSVLERPLYEVNGRPFFSQKTTA